MIVLKGKDAEKSIQLGVGREKDGKAVLHEIEAAYLLKKGIIKIKKTFEELIAGNEERYAVYEDLRERGYVLRLSEEGEFFRINRKGFRRNEERTTYILKVIKSPFTLEEKELFEDLSFSIKIRKQLVYAIVDGKEIRYITFGRMTFP
jgi:tRNA splicing endonuclease